MKNELTIEQALTIIGNALANPSLKLSQGEHLANIRSYELIKERILGKPEEKPVKEIKNEEVILP